MKRKEISFIIIILIINHYYYHLIMPLCVKSAAAQILSLCSLNAETLLGGGGQGRGVNMDK